MGLRMFVMLDGLGFKNAFGFIRGAGVACMSRHLDSAFSAF